MPTPVLIDTDTGVDDALALIFALRSPELSVKIITTVAGNVEVRKCTRNVKFLLNLLGADNIKVAEGAAKPLARPLFTAPEVHGKDGLGNLRVKKVRGRVTKNAVGEIIAFCKRYGKRGSLIALGPLTNIAIAYKQNPRAVSRIGSLITMGGAFRVPGNTGPVAEFNYYVDPEAAHAVLTSGLPITLIPLDVTERLVIIRKEFELRAARNPTAVTQTILRFTKFYMQYHQKTEGFYGGYAHDPIAVAVASHPQIVKTSLAYIDVETRGVYTRGMTIADFRMGVNKFGPTVNVALGIQKKKFLALFHERLWE
jgi:inosine-uridine nucleoside N-ribohydrolase